MNELQMFHRFHRGTGNFPLVAGVESWWRMPIHVKEALERKWAAEDKENKEKKRD